MNIRNNFFKYFVPNSLLRQIVMTRLKGRGVALMYHEVLPDNFGPEAWTVVKCSDFEMQMKYIKKYFDTVTIEEALLRATGETTKNKPFAVITFDDGYAGNLLYVLPIIENLQIPIHVFVSSQATETSEVYWYDKIISLFESNENLQFDLDEYGLGVYEISTANNGKKSWAAIQKVLDILKTLSPTNRKKIVDQIVSETGGAPGNLRMMTVIELKKLSESRFVTIGGHSHCHNILTQLSDEDLKNSLELNRKKLVEWTGQEIYHFSYPNGDFDGRVATVVKNTGYKTSVTVEGKRWTEADDPYMLPRFGVGRFDSMELFIARLGGLT